MVRIVIVIVVVVVASRTVRSLQFAQNARFMYFIQAKDIIDILVVVQYGACTGMYMYYLVPAVLIKYVLRTGLY